MWATPRLEGSIHKLKPTKPIPHVNGSNDYLWDSQSLCIRHGKTLSDEKKKAGRFVHSRTALAESKVSVNNVRAPLQHVKNAQ
eukprot:1038914-Amphidinium_carterae.1